MTGVFRHRYRYAPTHQRGIAALSVAPKNATYSGALTETVGWDGTLAKTVPTDGSLSETTAWSGVTVRQNAIDGSVSETLEWAGGGEKISFLDGAVSETLTWEGAFDLQREAGLTLTEALTWDGTFDLARAGSASLTETVSWTGNFSVPGATIIPEIVADEFEISLGDGAVTVAVPAGTVDGDMLIAVWNGDGTPATPAGWRLGYMIAGNFVVRTGFFWRVADSEPADYTFTAPGATYAVGAILRIEGIDRDPFEAGTGYATASDATRTNPGIVTREDNTLLLLYTDGGNAYTMPGGWELATGNTATNIAQRLEETAGTQTAFSATMPGGSAVWETFLVGIRAGYPDGTTFETPAFVSEDWAVNGPSVTVDVPSGVVDGDMLIAYSNSDAAPAAVSGWELGPSYIPLTGPKIQWYWRVADSEPADYTFTAPGGGYNLAGIMKVTGVSTTSPFMTSNAGAVGDNPGGGRLNPGVYAAYEDCLLLCYSDGTSNTTDPSGWTKVSGAPGSNVIAKTAGAEGDTGALEIAQVTNGFYFTHMVALRPKAILPDGSETISYTGSLSETAEWAGAWAGERAIVGTVTETVGWTGAFDLARAGSGALTETAGWSGSFLTDRAAALALSETAGWAGAYEKVAGTGLSLTETAAWAGTYLKIVGQTLSLSYTTFWGSFYAKIGGALCTLTETAEWAGSGEATRAAGTSLTETITIEGTGTRSAYYSGALTETVVWVGDYGQPDAPSRTLTLTETLEWTGDFVIIRTATLDLTETVSGTPLIETLRLRTVSLTEAAGWDGVGEKSTPVTLTADETATWAGVGAKIGIVAGAENESCVWAGGGYATRGGVMALSDTAALYPDFVIEHIAGGRTINLTVSFGFNLDFDSNFEYDFVVKVTIDARPGLSYLIGRPTLLLVQGAPWKNKDGL